MPDVKGKIRYYPNSSLYLLGKKYRYVETEYIHSNFKYHTSETERTVYLNKVLKIAAEGADMETLANALISDSISKEDAREYINPFCSYSL
jgi:CRISPR/Cas system-associated exonuclease Cas4 (RecB family)